MIYFSKKWQLCLCLSQQLVWHQQEWILLLQRKQCFYRWEGRGGLRKPSQQCYNRNSNSQPSVHKGHENFVHNACCVTHGHAGKVENENHLRMHFICSDWHTFYNSVNVKTCNVNVRHRRVTSVLGTCPSQPHSWCVLLHWAKPGAWKLECFSGSSPW
jgi:hypothetical protein